MSITHKFLHTPHPQRRDVLNDLERDYSDAIERTMRSKFRSIEDVATATSFHHHLALLTGRAVPGSSSTATSTSARPTWRSGWSP